MSPWSRTFEGKSVLVTGHTGFKGSWLSLWLHLAGARVTGYALPPPTEPSNFELSQIGGILSGHHEADVRDAERLARVVLDTQPDFVFHLAAQSLVRRGYVAPVETFEVNIMGACHLLDAVRSAGRPCVVVVVTSDKCYENDGQGRPFAEVDHVGGHDPYSASKGAAELVVCSYRRSFFPSESLSKHGVKVATARAGNVLGGGDWGADRLVVDIIRALSDGRPVRLRNPDGVRPWQHVLEPLSGYLLLAERMWRTDDPHWCSAWNFGPVVEDCVSVRALTEQFIEVWGAGGWVDASTSSQPAEAAVLYLATEKAFRRLGWEPRWRIHEAVRRTAAWHRRHAANPHADMRSACIEDVRAYEASLAEIGVKEMTP